MKAARSCRFCGCTDLQACPGGCSWTLDQRADAFHWAMSSHLAASDNDDVIVPPRPIFTEKVRSA